MNAQFDALQNKINAQQVQDDARFDGLHAIEAKRDADNAREYNYSVVAGSTTMQFRSIVKHVGGHPLRAGLPHAVDKVVFEENYEIGDGPPCHLMPLNYAEINELEWRIQDFRNGAWGMGLYPLVLHCIRHCGQVWNSRN
ncbi:hypothetical protein CASFOL_013483 [Castilleja foliolosa]|uniref:Uncharacterized protein n=1 Tax=Castilleja foliolosa TaxID=1961234 RepID=A0ABD3DK65_9LAMI